MRKLVEGGEPDDPYVAQWRQEGDEVIVSSPRAPNDESSIDVLWVEVPERKKGCVVERFRVDMLGGGRARFTMTFADGSQFHIEYQVFSP